MVFTSLLWNFDTAKLTSRDWLNFDRLGELVLARGIFFASRAGLAHRARLARRGRAGPFGLYPRRLIGHNYLYGNKIIEEKFRLMLKSGVTVSSVLVVLDWLRP